MKKATFGLDENIAAALSYITFIAGLIFYFSEKENKTVRFNALQSILICVAVAVIEIILSILAVIPVLGWIFSIILGLLGLAYLVLTIYLIVQTYNGKKVELPFVSDIAEKNS
ncbi:MAG: DUF4870 domain-containing protein [Oscillospiraceae bacterium]|jgi:uncharacterized membrane protein|nr:DUF4870 domain-containing protein [Oscillospiraceae bacterium]